MDKMFTKKEGKLTLYGFKEIELPKEDFHISELVEIVRKYDGQTVMINDFHNHPPDYFHIGTLKIDKEDNECYYMQYSGAEPDRHHYHDLKRLFIGQVSSCKC